MSIRLLVRTDDAGMAAAVGGSVHTDYREFVIEHEELENFLREPERQNWTYTARRIIGEVKP